MKKIILVTICVLFASISIAQMPQGEYSSKNKKAIFIFQDAVNFYQKGNDIKASEEAKKAIEKDPQFIEPHLLLAELFQTKGKIQEAINEYINAISINPNFNLNNFYNIGMLEISLGKYQDAQKDFERFLKKTNINPTTKETAKQQVANCIFALEAIKNPVPFEPKNLGEGVNSESDEYFPATTADDNTFLFTRNNRSEQMTMQEDFYLSKKYNNIWPTAVPLYGINTPTGNEGAPSLSADGQLLFFTACQDNPDGSYSGGRKGFGSCDIFYSQKSGERWTKPYNMGPMINTKNWESQPSFSADGKTLYFVSNRPGGLGAEDIYYSVLDDKGAWGIPKNIGSKINSSGQEESVFIHPDGKTLYFSSNGHTGMGGLDIYVVRKNENGEWGDPKNLGYPINTFNEENSLLVNGAGNLAYMASNRQGGYGGLDLYQFELYEAARPDKITYVKGKVFDAKTKAPLGSHFELIDLATGNQIITSDADGENGQFLVTLPANRNYALNVSQKGYLFYSENFSLKDVKDYTKPYLMDVPMQTIDTGTVVELKNIFFETGKFELLPESKIELDKLILFLKGNITLKIQINGHTDNVGDKKSNQVLSQNRAKSVYDYLISNSVEASRLTYIGFGDTKPKVKNDTESNRALNRRTEFKIIGK